MQHIKLQSLDTVLPFLINKWGCWGYLQVKPCNRVIVAELTSEFPDSQPHTAPWMLPICSLLRYPVFPVRRNFDPYSAIPTNQVLSIPVPEHYEKTLAAGHHQRLACYEHFSQCKWPLEVGMKNMKVFWSNLYPMKTLIILKNFWYLDIVRFTFFSFAQSWG